MQREEVTLVYRFAVLVGYLVLLLVQEVIRHPAVLRTSPSVGTPPGKDFGDITTSGIGDTECAVNERLQFDVRHRLVDGAYLVYTQLTRQNDPFEAHVTQLRHLPGRTVVALGGGVQTDRRKVIIQETEVLDDERVHSY